MASACEGVIAAAGSIISKLFGSAVSEAVAFSAGVAIGPVLAPVVQELKNETWSRFPNVPPDPGVLAEGVAQGQVDEGAARKWASEHGYGDSAFSALVSIANVGPGMAQAFNLWRRQQINEAGFRRALKRLGLEAEWIDALWAVREEVLDPGQLAAAIHRGLIPDPGLLKGEQPTAPFSVEAYPVYPVDAVNEAQASGYDKDRLGVLVGLQGLPMGPHEAAQALFRGVITHGDYIRAFNESNSRNEWAAAVLEQSRQIPTARDFLENALRGYTDLGDALQGAARHGMSEDDATLIYQNQGRPMNIHDITKALAWGANFNPEPGEIKDPYDASTVEGSVKPGYYEMFKALKYTLPSAMYFRTLQTQGVLTEAEAKMWYLRLGWPPELAAQVAHAFAKGAGGSAKEATAANLRAEYEGLFLSRADLVKALTDLGYSDGDAQDLADLGDAARVKAYRDRVVTAIYKAFLAHQITEGDARVALADDGIDPAAIGHLIQLWTREAGLSKHQLTQAQIVGAYKRAVLTFAAASAELVARGLTATDAKTLLDSAATPLTDAEVKAGLAAGTLSQADAEAALARSGHDAKGIAQLIALWTPPPAGAEGGA